MGPLTSAGLWNGARKDMNLDRGPWKSPCDYTKALGDNEMAWIKSYAEPRMNYHRSMTHQELPQDGIELLAQYIAVAPYLVPALNDEVASANVLWHPDLHLDNVFVDPETCEITRIVNWQSARVAPLYYQSDVPRMFRHSGHVRNGWVVPQWPENFETLSDEEQKRIDDDLESETMHKYYEAQVYKRALRHWAVLQQPDVQVIRKPVWLVTGVWENRDLFFLREALMSLSASWEDLFPNGGTPCPIAFSSKDFELHAQEEENMDGVGQMLKLFRDQAVLPVDGMIDPQGYEIARKNCLRFKEIFIGLAKDEDERELFAKLWPYQSISKESYTSSILNSRLYAEDQR